jgi:hypothetical protein
MLLDFFGNSKRIDVVKMLAEPSALCNDLPTLTAVVAHSLFDGYVVQQIWLLNGKLVHGNTPESTKFNTLSK